MKRVKQFKVEERAQLMIAAFLSILMLLAMMCLTFYGEREPLMVIAILLSFIASESSCQVRKNLHVTFVDCSRVTVKSPPYASRRTVLGLGSGLFSPSSSVKRSLIPASKLVNFG